MALDAISLIILAHSRKKVTERCLNSIFQRTFMTPYELVLISMGGKLSDPTIPDYFDSIRDEYWPMQQEILGDQNLLKNVITIHNETNVGLQPGRNQGMAAATGNWMMWLDNDAFIDDDPDRLPERPTGWVQSHDCLGRFVYWLREHRKRTGEICILGQTGSYWGPHKIDWRRRCIGRFLEVDAVMGYNVAFDREVYDVAGPIDDFYGVRGRQDTEFCFNAKYHGFHVYRAGYLGISHKAGGLLGEKFAKKFGENTDYLYKKWNHPKRLKRLNLIPKEKWVHD